MKGALHVHTTYSDGELSLAALRHDYTARGYSFACLADHAEFFDAPKAAAYRLECAALSDASFRFVPGLEYECPGRIHILGLGITKLIGTRDPQEVILDIERSGGLSVIAHPRTQDFGVVESLRGATGIEAWNTKYDGRYAPRSETFALIRRVRERDARVWAFYGQDLHFRNQYQGLHVELADVELDDHAILSELRGGRYAARSGELLLPSDAVLSADLLERFARVNGRSRRVWRFATETKAMLDRWGVTVPPGFKSRLRRLF